MRKTLPLLLAATLVLTACAGIRDSRVNPFNWFGQSRSERIEPAANTNPLIPRGGGLFARARARWFCAGCPTKGASLRVAGIVRPCPV